MWLPIIRRWEVKCMPTLEWSAFKFWLSMVMVVVLRWNVLATTGMDRICSSHNTSLCLFLKTDQTCPIQSKHCHQVEFFLFFSLLFLYCYYFADSKHVTWSLMIRYWEMLQQSIYQMHQSMYKMYASKELCFKEQILGVMVHSPLGFNFFFFFFFQIILWSIIIKNLLS